VAVRPGDQVAKGQKLLMLEAMKMQTTIVAQRDGKVRRGYSCSQSKVPCGKVGATNGL
jgi:pyruvate carboxylase